jgi:hypothetical protein
VALAANIYRVRIKKINTSVKFFNPGERILTYCIYLKVLSLTKNPHWVYPINLKYLHPLILPPD